MPSAHRDKRARGKVPTRRILLALLPVLLLGAAVVPAQAVAQDGSNRCTATVRATSDRAVADVDLECNEPILSVQLEMNERNEGSIEASSGTRCERRGNSRREFDCFPEGENQRTISFRYRLDGNTPVYAEPRLRIRFTVDFEDGSSETLTEEVSGCPRERVDRVDRDTGRFPAGGVDSGAGGKGSSDGSDRPAGGAVPSIVVSLTVLGLLGATAAVRRRRGAR